MTYHAGDFDTTETVDIPFNTFTSNDPAASSTITNLVAGDLHVHKDGGVTQRSSSAGVTISVNFDGITGNHIAHIDLSDNTDVGFYADGSRYLVRMEGTTVDAGTVNAWIGGWSVGCTLRPTTSGRTLDVNATGEAGLDLDNTSGTLDAAQFGADFITAAKIADNAFVAANFSAASLDGKGDWNTVVPASLSEFNARSLPSAESATAAELAKVPKSDGVVTWNAAALASINAQCDASVETYHLDHLFAVNYDPAAKPGVATALLNELIESDAGVSRYTVNALEQAPTGGSAPTATEIVDEWETQSQADPTGFHVNVMEVSSAAQATIPTVVQVNARTLPSAEIATVAELAKVPKSDGAVTLNATVLAAIADEVLEQTEVVNDGSSISLAGGMRIVLSVGSGDSSGGGTSSLVFDKLSSSTTCVAATVDANGNRTVTTRDAT